MAGKSQEQTFEIKMLFVFGQNSVLHLSVLLFISSQKIEKLTIHYFSWSALIYFHEINKIQRRLIVGVIEWKRM